MWKKTVNPDEREHVTEDFCVRIYDLNKDQDTHELCKNLSCFKHIKKGAKHKRNTAHDRDEPVTLLSLYNSMNQIRSRGNGKRRFYPEHSLLEVLI